MAWMSSFPDLEIVCCSMSSSNYCFLSCIQISQEAGQVVWYSHFFESFPQFVVTHTVKGFSVVNEADVFLELSCFFDDQTDVGDLISHSSAFLNPAWTSTSSGFMYCWSLTWRKFQHYFATMWDECNCVIAWIFFSIALLWDWNENGLFPVLWPLLSFPNLLAYWVQHFSSSIF